MTDYFVDDATGSDLDDGLTEGNAFATITHALDSGAGTHTFAAGDKVWVKASATYTEDVPVDVPGTATAPITIEGYTTTTGDNGRAAITAASVSAVLIGAITTSGVHFYVWKNFLMTGGSGDVYDASAGDSITFVNCRITSGGADGVGADNNISFFNCEIDNNTGDGVDVDNDLIMIGCRVHNNGSTRSQVNSLNGVFLYSTCYAGVNSQAGIRCDGNAGPHVFSNCTFDGENTTTSFAIEVTSSTLAQSVVVVNDILYDFATGVDVGTAMGDHALIGHNLINSNTTDYNGIANTLGNDQTGAPVFTNEAADDYSLGSSSPAIDAGFDAADIT